MPHQPVPPLHRERTRGLRRDMTDAERRLVIELDGVQHGEDRATRRVEARTAWLAANGHRVLRFWNNEVLANFDGVLSSIRAASDSASNREPLR